MDNAKTLSYIKAVLTNMPKGWLSTTTHRLDIYNESLAKVQFLEKFDEEKLMQEIDFSIKFFLNKRLSDTNLELHEKVACEFRKICKNIASREMVLTHRDFIPEM